MILHVERKIMGVFLDALPLHLDKLSNRQNNMNSHQKNILASETRKKR